MDSHDQDQERRPSRAIILSSMSRRRIIAAMNYYRDMDELADFMYDLCWDYIILGEDRTNLYRLLRDATLDLVESIEANDRVAMCFWFTFVALVQKRVDEWEWVFGPRHPDSSLWYD